MNESLSELREFAINKKGDNESLYGHYFLRKVSPFFTWIFLKLGISSNYVTFLSLVFAFFGSILLLSTSILFWILGWILFQIYFILDCSDGEVAVLRDQTSDFGAFLDKICHPITNSILVYFSSFGAYRITGNFYLLLFSAIGAIAFNMTSVMRYAVSDLNFGSAFSEEGKEESLIHKIYSGSKDLIKNPGGTTHLLILLLIFDLITTGNWRIFYPLLITVMGLIFVLKRYVNISSHRSEK